MVACAFSIRVRKIPAVKFCHETIILYKTEFIQNHSILKNYDCSLTTLLNFDIEK